MSADGIYRSPLSSRRLNWAQGLWQDLNFQREEKIPITSKHNSPGVMESNSNTDYAGCRPLQAKTTVRNDAGGRPLQTNTTVRKYCCRFCLKNGELDVFYKSHPLKDRAGNIVCPILSKYTCPCCGATGENAHTIRHCPLNANYAKMLQLTSSMRRNAAGHITSFRV